jgi:hypothetical protein
VTARPRETRRIGRIVKGQRLDQLTIRMPRMTREQLAQLAELLGVSDSAAVVDMLQKRLAAITPDQWSALRHIRDLRESLHSPMPGFGAGFGDAADRVATPTDPNPEGGNTP